MSYTARPSLSRTTRGRGGAPRGRGRGTGDPQQARPGQTDAETEGATGGQDPSEKVQRRDAYTVFVPDEKKRNKIQRDAQKEEAKYKKYKDSQKLGHVSYVGTVGGGLSHPESAQQRHVQQRAMPSPARRAALHKANQKKEEDKTFAQKKNTARNKAESNERRESDRQATLDEERRRVNEKFLSRLENGSK